MSASNQPYLSLLAKIKDLAARQDQAYGDQIRCRAGCYHCCHPPDSLFQVEAEALEAGIAQLTPQQKDRITTRLRDYEQDNTLLCPLLEDGVCQVYEARPAICRTQGYALYFRNTPEEQDKTTPAEEATPADLSWCELNFTDFQPKKEIAFDVKRLNTMLSLITQLGWPDQPSRRSLVDAIQKGLTTNI